ncbi:MAG: hypothetical protein U9N72_10800 [Bacteroidota bacterium]|nr:hypothetical protein [Bacteroidota bacterium]
MNKIKIKLKHIINASIITWLIIWLYYIIFNWDVFSINLKTNLGFAVIGGFPFVFFFIVGLLFLILIKYFNRVFAVRKLGEEKDLKNKIALLEKDIEVLKLKETLFKMQSEEMSRSNANLSALHQRLDEITSQLEREKGTSEETDSSNEEKEDKNSKNKK